ncbi:MAG: 4-(cytidine 5'-diphospho)-2-C-methyl-D-erythritol kinase [Rhodocyclaceae bacterium]|nr:4-(cytidine 5'-diphospho)-2-C-methyl-D-erythritol kinase [Rhodocyclaceae bacterium]
MTTWDWTSDWPAPAKINLFLHVTGRRDDGYHTLQTAFRFLDLADSLRFSPRNDTMIVRTHDIPGVAVNQDLVIKAAQLLQSVCATQQGVSITVKKRLPMGGGLGGGSSDAATTLIALNQLWTCALDTHQLQALGLRLGADVPVFIHGKSCFAEGVGEQFSDIQIPPTWYLLVAPPVSVPTEEIFRAPELSRDTPVIAPNQWHFGFGHNDMEPVAASRYPQVAAALSQLRALGPARMSGSGACCFAEFATESQALNAQRQLPADIVSFVTPGVDRHPLLATTTTSPRHS